MRYLTKKPYCGKGICSWCGKPVPKGRRSWCSQACVHEWLIRSSGSYLCSQVKKRDHGICALCGLDTVALKKELDEQFSEVLSRRFRVFRAMWHSDAYFIRLMPPDEPFRLRLAELGLKSLGRALWEADHVHTVIEGGGGCGLENIRTLCWKCHKGETAKLRQRLTEYHKLVPRSVEAWLFETTA